MTDDTLTGPIRPPVLEHCPMCGAPPALPYGTYACPACRDAGLGRSIAMQPEIDRLRTARLERERVWQDEHDRKARLREQHQSEITARLDKENVK